MISHRFLRAASLMALPLALAACNASMSSSGSTPTPATTVVTTPTPTTPTTTQFPANLTDPGPLQPTGVTSDSTFAAMINGVRTTAGAGPLAYNAQLDQAAQGHANDMLTNNYFSHTGLNGSSAAQRVAATGYAATAVGENIAQGQQSETDVLNSWQNSPGHKANNENPVFQEFGLGQAGTGGDARWVLVFGSQ
ncbi:MAG: CAP domain-containing protein [Pseudomonadota bacterium]